MGFRPTNSNYQQCKVFSNYNSASGEAYTGGEALVLTNGYATAAGATSTLTHIVLGQGTVMTAADSILRKNQMVDVIPVHGRMLIEATVREVSSGKEFNVTTTGASTTGLVLVAAFASTVANVYQYGVAYHHGLQQQRRIASSSSAKVTIERPFENPDGTLHKLAVGEKFSISQLYPGLATARISTKDTAMHVANRTTGNGKIKIVGIPKLGNVGNETVKVRFS